jgi:glyoxylase-like metal-dependent hydrolase (beta-lactamase superfamily II)/ferredoxin
MAKLSPFRIPALRIPQFLMASIQRSYPTNVAGNFFVDDTCIDCDLCRQIAPTVFKEESDHSVVYRQPEDDTETLRAAMALVACPTGSIGARQKTVVKEAIDSFPECVEENVYFCGYASPNSYGAASYLITRPEGNVLVDSPRFARNLVSKLEHMGGVSLMFLTHQDDVADHEKFHDHFGCSRIIHRADARSIGAERMLEGRESVQLDKDLLVIPTPGHTRGHAVLLYRDKYLFTGDHLAWSDRRRGLVAFRNVTWYSWPEQTESMKRLLGLGFEWVLPGHGRRAHLLANVMQLKLKECVEWMNRER